MLRTLHDLNVKGKRVLVRVDFNVPLTKKGAVSDDTRIRAALPTLKHLLSKGATLVLVTHLGRPKGVDDSLRLDAVGKQLSKILKRKVIKLDDTVGHDVEEQVHAAKAGSVILLENVRFYAEEEKNDVGFAQALARLADVYVNDAFGTCHRAHASVDAVTRFLPSAAGLLLEKEIKALDAVLVNPKRPFIAVMGGAKVSDKIGVIENLLKKADAILIGGAMMFTFQKSIGRHVGTSLVENDKLTIAHALLKNSNEKIVLPVDTVIARDIKDKKTVAVPIDGILLNMKGLDIGPQTASIYAAMLHDAKTIVWNGPMGVFEIPRFAKGTLAIAKAVATCKGMTVVGGGETAEAVHKAGVEKRITHVSTGGGASLEYLEGKKLPGIAALEIK